MKTQARQEARRLRSEQGLSIKDIAALVGVSVASVSVWVRDIELSETQRERLRQRNPAFNMQRSGHAVWAAACRARRARAQEEGRAQARLAEPLHVSGCMLYWGEGSKSRRVAQISNSDVDLLRLFVGFLRAYFAIPDQRIRVQCHLFADHSARRVEVEQYWLDALRLSPASLTKSQVNAYSRSSARKRQNVLPWGTCRVTVCSVDVVQHILGAIQEYGGFERPEWLG